MEMFCKNVQRIKIIIVFLLDELFSPHHPQNHIRRNGHFGDGTKDCTDVHEVPIWHFKLLCFSFVKFHYARLRFKLIRVLDYPLASSWKSCNFAAVSLPSVGD
jgi:hypothetical protein